MKRIKKIPFKRSGRIILRATVAAKRAIEKRADKKRQSRGRPAKGLKKYIPISIRFHPGILIWAKREAKKRGVGYQTVINESLMKKISAN